MDYTYTVCDAEGVVIADRLTRDECWHLRGLERTKTGAIMQARTPMVRAKKRRPYLWVANVDSSAITHAIRVLRGISDRLPIAAANFTGHWEHFSNEKGSGRVFAINTRTSFSYPTTQACASERRARLAA